VLTRVLAGDSLNDARIAREREVVRLRRMQAYAYHGKCRRTFVLEYFGARFRASDCAGCDNCAGTAFLPGARRPSSKFNWSRRTDLFRLSRR
jgi:ATP-dependent DNA helicase RecQ